MKKTALRQKRKFDIFQAMSQKKRSIADGLGALALGSVLTTGGVAAGVTAAASAASQVKHVQQASGDQELLHEWDDQEEENYRQWIRQLQDERSTQHEIDWAELDNEMAYREKLKRQTEENASNPIHWEDEQEKLLRQKYIEIRRKQKNETVKWEEQKAESDHRERIRQRQDANRKKPVVWDDADERKCQERYRKKYSSSCN